MQLTMAKRDIRRLLDDPDTPAPLRQRLLGVLEIRRFAGEKLLLPDSGSYTQYADLQRDVTLWMLTAAPELSLRPREWCYPLVGCFSYRGHFRRESADREAARLRRRGWDVALTPGLAYSTLGIARDPVLNTMLAYNDLQLAGILFHELAHEKLFVRGDTGFNESFASFVGDLGRGLYAEHLGLAEDTTVRCRFRQRRQQVEDLIEEARQQLATLYESAAPLAEKRSGKQRILEQLRARYEAIRPGWASDPGYDLWFADEGLNNARLALHATYESKVPAFEQLYREAGESLPEFYAAAERLAAVAPAERDKQLEALSQRAVAGARQTCDVTPPCESDARPGSECSDSTSAS